MRRVTVYYSGHVQGVGFRYTTHQISRDFDVTGYVRNLPDRRVELVAEGEAQELTSFLVAVRDHFAGQIRDEQTDKSAASGEFARFEVRH